MNEEKLHNWQRITYSEMLADLYKKTVIDKKTYQETLNNCKALRIVDQLVDGYSVEGLPKSDEGRLGVKINYTDIFHSINSADFNPALYLATLVLEYRKRNTDKKDISGFLSRGLRSLASLIREPIFAESIKIQLSEFDSTVTTEISPRQDAGDHTDVLLYFKKKLFRIWLFQFSDRGLPHDIERVTGQRGELPPGIHILCPLRTEYAIKYDSLLRQSNTVHNKLQSYNEQLANTSAKALKKIKTLTDRINFLKDRQLMLKDALEREKTLLGSELAVVAGWYLYSDNYISRLTEQILATNKYDSYESVREILIKPKEYLSKVQFFEK